MTHLLDTNEIVQMFDSYSSEKIFQFFTKDVKFKEFETVFIQNQEDQYETETKISTIIELPFKKEWKLITLKEKNNA